MGFVTGLIISGTMLAVVGINDVFDLIVSFFDKR